MPVIDKSVEFTATTKRPVGTGLEVRVHLENYSVTPTGSRLSKHQPDDAVVRIKIIDFSVSDPTPWSSSEGLPYLTILSGESAWEFLERYAQTIVDTLSITAGYGYYNG